MPKYNNRIKNPTDNGSRGSAPEKIYEARELQSLIDEAFKTLTEREDKKKKNVMSG